MSKIASKSFGFPVPNWTPPPRPSMAVLEGSYVRLERLSAAKHAGPLFAAYLGHDAVWDYLPNGPFDDLSEYEAWVQGAEASADPLFFAIQAKDTQDWVGSASYLRISPEAGSIEAGFLTFSPALQGTRASTEALFLMIEWAFESGYRRFEWKCDALNVPSRRAAERLGLSFEGIFRQATVVKGRNRDTAWFAAIDSEWPALRNAFTTWLHADNFDDAGHQKQRLSDLTRPILVSADPTFQP